MPQSRVACSWIRTSRDGVLMRRGEQALREVPRATC